MSTPTSAEKDIFSDALEIEAPSERAAFIMGACRGDAQLRERVEALLRAHDKSNAFLAPEPVNDPLTVLSSTPIREEPGALIGRYKLLEKLGEGGFGAVYVAEQREPVKRRVALKIIKLGMDTKHVVARFEAERQALAVMDHPHISRVLDAGATDTGRPYFVMELVRGVPITRYCDENSLPTRERLKLFIQVCHALQHAHQKGIIHRDIKPSNILVTLHDGVPVPKVIDFGIAKATQGELTDKTIYTQFQQFIGTPAYMSPEQAEMSGLDVDTRSDIYSLGVLLYELLVGKTPFDGKELLVSGLDEMRRTLREKEPLKPSTRLRGMADDESSTTAKRRGADLPKLMYLLRGDLDWVVMKCLEKDRTRRYETASGVAMDVKRFLSNETVLARPPSTLYRFQKLARRNRLAFVAIAAVASVLVLGVIVSTWQAVRATRAEQEQSRLREDAENARASEVTQRQQADEARYNEVKLRRQAEAQAYAADMKAAQVAMEQNNRGQAADLLNRHRPKPGEEDLRGIEWRYLWQAVQGNEIHTWQHPNKVLGASFSPDGRIVISDCFDGFLRIWDVTTRKLVTQLEHRFPDDYSNTSFCFSPDGRTLAATHKDGIVLIDSADWQVVRRFEASPGEQESLDREASLAWSPDGRRLAARLRLGTTIWDTANWETTFLPTRTSSGRIAQRGRIAFAPDGDRLAVCFPNAIELWDLSTRRKTAELTGVLDSRSVAISSQGQWLAAGNNKGELRLWNLRAEHVVWTNQAHRSEVLGLAFSGDGKRLASGAFDQLIHIWDVTTRQKIQTFRGHLNEVWSLEFSPDNRFLVSASKDGTVKLWDASAQRQPAQWWLDPAEWPLGFAADGWRFITITTNGTALRHWDGPQLVKTAPLAEPLSLDELHRVILSPKSVSLFAGATNGAVRTYSVETGRVIRPVMKIVDELSWLCAVSADDRWLAGVARTRGDSGALCVWDSSSGATVARFPELGEKSAFHLRKPATFSRDGRLLALGTTDYAVKVWDMVTQRQIHLLTGHSWWIFALHFSEDGRYLASSSGDGEARVWDMATGQEVVAPLRGHGSGVGGVHFSPDAKTLVTSGYDHTVRFWHLPTGQEMLLFDRASRSAMGGPSRASLLSPTGELLVVWDYARQAVRVEKIPTLAEIETAERRKEESK